MKLLKINYRPSYYLNYYSQYFTCQWISLNFGHPPSIALSSPLIVNQEST